MGLLNTPEEAEEEWVRPLWALQEEGSAQAGQGEAQVILRAAGLLESQFQESLHQSPRESRQDAAVPVPALHRQAQETGRGRGLL